ncbi:AAA family ATPase [Microbulbifer marinus]|uniref:AAA domain-containing protein n=1 Tax=Microbulbifer marinus TaxID=658218 RepID=A0A1H3WFA3_9GAMM|nr:AAA family ATPase [Microbulbifer marinus]SDZ85827.1 AAA domain-containing protein [Microbulbifer marinus]
MNIAADTPRSMHREVLEEVEKLLSTVDVDTTDNKLAESLMVAREVLSKIQAEVAENLVALENAADWDTFTVAFYGETNAGKSTIIEALRMLLGEEAKKDSQRQFKTLQEKYALDSESIRKTRADAQAAEAALNSLEERVKGLEESWAQRDEQLRRSVQQYDDDLRRTWESLNAFVKIYRFFFKLPEHLLLDEAEKVLASAEKHYDSEKAQLELDIERTSSELARLSQYADRLQSHLQELAPFADGAIIGDGRPDFTQVNQRYLFSVGGQSVALLDVPGIEGKESTVEKSIWDAVRKAHAVFYVTSKAAAPQTGDGKVKGTLEKIRGHLGSQTEVWTLFNKRITSPTSVAVGALVSSGEQSSLEVLNKKMNEHLGDSYQGALSVSGLVAFLALAECLVPDEKYARKQEKFFKQYDKASLLAFSGLDRVLEIFSQDSLSDYMARIRSANYQKTAKVLEAALSDMDVLQSTKFIPLVKHLEREYDSLVVQLGSITDGLKNRLSAITNSLVDEFKKNARKKAYSKIDKGISDDALKRHLERGLKTVEKSLNTRFSECVASEMALFSEEVRKLLERFEKHVGELVDMHSNFAIGGYEGSDPIELDIKGGINYFGLMGALAPLFWIPKAIAIGGVWGPIGVAAIVLTSLIAFYKSVKNVFRSDFKRSQQKKAVDENLKKIAGGLKAALNERTSGQIKEVNKHIETLQGQLSKPISAVQEINEILGSSGARLKILRENLLIKGVKL